LVFDQIETWRSVIAQHAADQRVGLAAMMGLMIKEMIERWREYLFDILRIDEGTISDRF